MYEIIVFTAGDQNYADAILNYLDPRNEIFDYRFYRHHCTFVNKSVYVKDLRVIGNRDLKNIVLIDNAVYSFGYQLRNGIPIVPYLKGEDDRELLGIKKHLFNIMDAPDLRIPNSHVFGL